MPSRTVPATLALLMARPIGEAQAGELDKAEDPVEPSWWAEWSVDRYGSIEPTLLVEPFLDTTIEY